MNDKVYYIYEITNDINGMKYIGQHLGKIDDSYMGSGIHIKRAIAYYGVEHFHKSILCICKDAEDANIKEKEFIAKVDAVNNPLYYNIAEGGNSIPIHRWYGEENPFYGKKHTEETKKKISEKMAKYLENPENHWNFGKHWDEEHKQALREKLGTKIECWNENEKHSFNSFSEAVQWLGISKGFIKQIRKAIETKTLYRNLYWKYQED